METLNNFSVITLTAINLKTIFHRIRTRAQDNHNKIIIMSI